MTSKLLKRVAIVFLIAVFSIAGVVACSGADITSSVGGDTGKKGSTVSASYPNSPMDGPWDNDSYRTVYVPWAGISSKDANGNTTWHRATVSYMDRDTLTQLWKDQMDYKSENNVDFFLKSGNNGSVNVKAGDLYYFFDANFNIRHKKYPNIIIKEFVGGVMTMYYHDDPGSTSKGTITVGGLYRTALDDIGKVGNDKYIGYFLNGRQVGDLEVLILNVGASMYKFTHFGLDITYYGGENRNYSGLTRDAEEWYKVESKPETLVQVLKYDTMRNKYKMQNPDGTYKNGTYFYFSKGAAEINR